MDFILDYYFDFGTSSATNFDAVLDGFWITIKLSIIAGVLVADLGPGPGGPAAAARAGRSRRSGG